MTGADRHYEATRQVYEKYAGQADGFYSSRRRLLGYSPWQIGAWQIAYHLLRRQLKHDPGTRSAVEVGCGRGDFTIQLARRFPRLIDVHGCDFSEGAVAVAQRQVEGSDRIHFEVGNLLELPYPDRRFDVTCCVNVLLHIRPEDLPRGISELARITRRHLVLEIKNARSPYYRYYHPGEVDGVSVHPTTLARTGELLAAEGFALQRAVGIFLSKRLSPMVIMLASRQAG